MNTVWHDVEQGSDEWHRLRLGIVTASSLDKIMAGRVARQKYIHLKAAEIVIDQPILGRTTADMQRGHDLEAAIRAAYEFETGASVDTAGFATLDTGDRRLAGCSPDGLVGADGLFEAKSKAPQLMVPILAEGTSNGEFRWQVQGQLWVTGRAWCDLVIHCPGIGTLTEHIVRDEADIHRICDEVMKCNAERDYFVECVRHPRPASNSAAVMPPSAGSDLPY